MCSGHPHLWAIANSLLSTCHYPPSSPTYHSSGSFNPGNSIPGRLAQLLRLGYLPTAPQTRPFADLTLSTYLRIQQACVGKPVPRRRNHTHPAPLGSTHSPWELRVQISILVLAEKLLKSSFRVRNSTCSCAPSQEAEGTGQSGGGCAPRDSPRHHPWHCPPQCPHTCPSTASISFPIILSLPPAPPISPPP